MNFFPHWQSYISTKALDDSRVSVSQVEIDPHAILIIDKYIHFIEIKPRAFDSDVVLWYWTDGGDDVEILQVPQTNLCRQISCTGDIIFVNEEDHRLSLVFFFQILANIYQFFRLSRVSKY